MCQALALHCLATASRASPQIARKRAGKPNRRPTLTLQISLNKDRRLCQVHDNHLDKLQERLWEFD